VNDEENFVGTRFLWFDGRVGYGGRDQVVGGDVQASPGDKGRDHERAKYEGQRVPKSHDADPHKGRRSSMLATRRH
jgi:hypothetical protein